jgi:uncharacterized membrane protein
VSAAGSGVRRAAVLGTVTGARTFLAPAALALRGRLGKVAKFTLPVLAAGELVGDKLPSAPPRIEGPGLVGRVVSGAFAGRVSGGNPGLRAGAALALASAYPSQLLRQNVVKHTPPPDIACAVPEDLLGIALAASASREPSDTLPPQDDVDGPKTQALLEFSAHQHGTHHGFVAAGALGVGSALVGVAAMTTAQRWVYGFTGGGSSEAPAEVGEKLLGALGITVGKKRRPALGAVMHLAYGKSWGLPFGLIAARGGRTPRPRDGVALGLGVWLVSLAELPALGVAPPPWRQSPTALAQDLGFHLVYGVATAAALEAFTA